MVFVVAVVCVCGGGGERVFVVARQIAPKVLALVGGAIDEGVDGLEPQGPQDTLVAGLEPSGDLFGGPSFRKPIADESPQRRIFLEYGFHAACAADRLRRREAANNARWARRCGAVPAIRWISLVEAPRRWRRSSGRPRS